MHCTVSDNAFNPSTSIYRRFRLEGYSGTIINCPFYSISNNNRADKPTWNDKLLVLGYVPDNIVRVGANTFAYWYW